MNFKSVIKDLLAAQLYKNRFFVCFLKFSSTHRTTLSNRIKLSRNFSWNAVFDAQMITEMNPILLGNSL